MDINEVAKGWVERWAYEVGDPKRDEFEWVDEFEYVATHEIPEVGFKLILEILELEPSNHLIKMLAAGPLEDLLTNHGEKIIEKVESEAKSNDKFALLLSGVWQNLIPDHIWERVQTVCK